MLLTGVMSKMGVYGFLRILLPIFSEQMRSGADAAAVAGGADHCALGLRGVRAEGSEDASSLTPPSIISATACSAMFAVAA